MSEITKTEMTSYLKADSAEEAKEILTTAVLNRLTRERKKHRKEVDQLKQQIVRLSADNVTLRAKEVNTARRAYFAEKTLNQRSADLRRNLKMVAELRAAINEGNISER